MIMFILSVSDRSSDLQQAHPRPFVLCHTLTSVFSTSSSSQDRLEWNRESNELVSPSIGVAFPIIDGTPNLSPHAGRIIANEGSYEGKQEKTAAFREKPLP